MKIADIKLLYASFVLIIFAGCRPSTNNSKYSSNAELEATSFRGRFYVQPLNKIIALSLASGKSTIFFNFVDSTYCNIDINSAVGNITQSRKYYLNSSRKMVLENPLNDNRKSFRMIVNADSTVILNNSRGEHCYKLIPCGSRVNSLINSDNQLQRGEFLYPTLDVKEREFGAEDRFIEKEDGRIITISHPLRTKASRINLYKLF